jgi:hypothetical protein
MIYDFGCSYGEYALEPKALERFKNAVKTSDIKYTVQQYEDFINTEHGLFIVTLKETKQMPQMPVKDKISEILTAFEIYDGVYKREYIDTAIELKEEITPYLIKILENVLSNPSEYAGREDYFAHTYALMLLAHFKTSSAHKTIVDLFSLPGNLTDELFGDIKTEDLPVILLRTCGESFDLIKSLVLNKEADEYCRCSAIQTFVYAEAEGMIPREEVVSFLGSLFTGNEVDKDHSNFWSLLAIYICGLYPEELMDTIKKAYQDGLIWPGMVNYEEFEDVLSEGREKCRERVKKGLQLRSFDDIHAQMSWWACFDQNQKPPVSSFDEYTPPQKISGKKKSEKIGRNAPCPCGSGKKYKKCCLGK